VLERGRIEDIFKDKKILKTIEKKENLRAPSYESLGRPLGTASGNVLIAWRIGGK